MSYQQEFQSAKDNSEEFWKDKASQLDWFVEPSKVLSVDEQGIHHWFADSELNTAHLALDVHVLNGRGDQVALIYDSPVTNQKKQFTYLELLNEVAFCAGMLNGLGVVKGDRVIIYMPMIPESAIAMLACARIGAIHCVVFGGFAAPELAVRIDDAKAKIILSASCGIEITKVIEYKPLIDQAIDLSTHKPDFTVVLQREQHEAELSQARDRDWLELLNQAKPAKSVAVKGSDPLYILYTSGTTGKPKGVVRENGGHAVALKYSMEAIYNIKPGEVFWAVSDVGWVVGHSYIVYAPLLAGATTILYEGKPVATPDAGVLWRVVQEYGVKALFTAPTAYRAVKKEDPNLELVKQYNVSSLRAFYSAGERLDQPTYEWLSNGFNIPVIDNWWQTETGWAIASNMPGVEFLPIKPGSSTVPCPGYNIHILDDEGRQLPAGTQGNIAIKLPLPPSCLTSIWGDANRFHNNYLNDYPGYYISGDGGYLDDDGYLFVMGRVDDVINVAGHRLSTGEIEEVLSRHEVVAECAVVGRANDLKGHLPTGLVVLKNGVTKSSKNIIDELIANVRQEIGPVASFKEVYIVSRLPKTRSGKILRKTIRQIFDGDEVIVPSTIDDLSSLDEIRALL